MGGSLSARTCRLVEELAEELDSDCREKPSDSTEPFAKPPFSRLKASIGVSSGWKEAEAAAAIAAAKQHRSRPSAYSSRSWRIWRMCSSVGMLGSQRFSRFHRPHRFHSFLRDSKV